MKVSNDNSILTHFQGFVSEIRYASGENVAILSDYDITAGEGLMQLNDGVTELVYNIPTRRRRNLQENCGGYLFEGDNECNCDAELYGDVNGDCIVTKKTKQFVSTMLQNHLKN